MKYSFNKSEKLKSKKDIQFLFSKNARSIKSYPLLFIYHLSEDIINSNNFPVKVGVSVSKKKFKKAVQRNKVKRILREAYRLNKSSFKLDTLNQRILKVMILFVGNEMPDFKQIEKKMKKGIFHLNSFLELNINK